MRVYLDKDGDCCVDDGREFNLVFCPATDDDGSVLCPDVVHLIIDRFNLHEGMGARVKSLLQIQRGHQQEIEGLKRALDKRDAEIMALKAQVAGARDAALEEAAKRFDHLASGGISLEIRRLKSSAQSV